MIAKKIDANDVAVRRGFNGLAAELNRMVADAPSLVTKKARTSAYEIIRPRSLLLYDTERDPNCLLGKRYVCRGGGLLVVAQAGLGKSSLDMQAQICWALGESFFGIEPVRPLSSLLIQAENDIGDLSEMLKGVVNGLSLADRTPEIERRISIITENSKTGDDFVRYFDTVVGDLNPDLVVIDPLLAYIGGNVSDQVTCSRFLRNGLNPILQKHGCALILVHHTPKPARDPQERKGFVGQDFSYLGMGSAELVNWARAILSLREIEEGVFELRASKRGRRSGLGAPNDRTPAGLSPLIHLRHSDTGICWVRDNSMAELENSNLSDAVRDVLGRMGDEVCNKSTVCNLVRSVVGQSRSTVYKTGSFANRVFQAVIGQTQNPQQPSAYQVRKSMSDCPMMSDSGDRTDLSDCPPPPVGGWTSDIGQDD